MKVDLSPAMIKIQMIIMPPQMSIFRLDDRLDIE